MRSLIVVAIVAATATAVWAEIPRRARELATEGQAAHVAGDYARAAQAFEHAYVLAPSNALLFDLAQAYRLAGDCESAAIMYRRYLDASDDVDAREVAWAHLRDMQCTPPRDHHDLLVGGLVIGSVAAAGVAVMTLDDRTMSTSFGIGSVALLGTAVGVYLWDRRGGPSPQISASSRGVNAGIAWSF